MAKGGKVKNEPEAQKTSLNYDSEASTVNRSDLDSTTINADSNESGSDENAERLPMNEAIAFTSMIDSNINGRLQNLFQDTNHHFTTISNPQSVGSYSLRDDIRRSSASGFQNDALFGDIKSQTIAQEHEQPQRSQTQYFLNHQPQVANDMVTPFYHNFASSDTDPSPELPKSSRFEFNNKGDLSNSAPPNFQYNYSNTICTPKIKHEFDPNYSISPSLSDTSSFNSNTPGSSSYFHPRLSSNPENADEPKTSISSTSSKPSYSASTNSSAPLSSNELRNNSNDSTRSSDSESSLSTKKKKIQKLRGGTCVVCNKVIRRDMSRHMRIHEEVSRFRCVYPRDHCLHKTGFFNRQYDFKKHLLHFHFEFDDGEVKKFYSLNEKLPHWGTCSCGLRFTGGDWLKNHILTRDPAKVCAHLNTLRDRYEEQLEIHEGKKSE